MLMLSLFFIVMLYANWLFIIIRQDLWNTNLPLNTQSGRLHYSIATLSRTVDELTVDNYCNESTVGECCFVGGGLFGFFFVLFCFAGCLMLVVYQDKQYILNYLVFNLLDIVMCRLTHQDPTSGCGEISFVALMCVSLNLIWWKQENWLTHQAPQGSSGSSPLLMWSCSLCCVAWWRFSTM